MLITGYFHIITFLSPTCYSTITTLWLRWSCSSQFLYNSSFADKRTSSDKLIYNHQYHWNLAGHALYHCYWVRRRKTWLLQHNFIFLLLLRQRRKKIQCSLIHKKKSPQWLALYIFTLDVRPGASHREFVSPEIFHLLGTFVNQYNVDNFFFFASALHPVKFHKSLPKCPNFPQITQTNEAYTM